MALFFSGAVTSTSPLFKRLLLVSPISLDVSLLSPDSSYVCYTSADGGEPCSCRRSPRLLTNGYYDVTEDSFSWDDEGNVSLTPCKTSHRQSGAQRVISLKLTLFFFKYKLIFKKSNNLKCFFLSDPTDVPPPPDKEAPPPNMLIHEDICSEICQSKERFTQSLGSLSEVLPPSPFYTNTCCCQVSPEHTGEPQGH
uniref:Uncharacterized protein n=1 Tax=Amphilophus citrinellus TaxID=61819 RepID=A0A3Q0RW11_AMPCI